LFQLYETGLRDNIAPKLEEIETMFFFNLESDEHEREDEFGFIEQVPLPLMKFATTAAIWDEPTVRSPSLLIFMRSTLEVYKRITSWNPENPSDEMTEIGVFGLPVGPDVTIAEEPTAGLLPLHVPSELSHFMRPEPPVADV
jgi:hypothetical protein